MRYAMVVVALIFLIFFCFAFLRSATTSREDICPSGQYPRDSGAKTLVCDDER